MSSPLAGRRGVVLAVVVAVMAGPSAVRAQATEASAVQAVVERFLVAAGSRDFDGQLALLAPNATINVARLRDGRWTHTAQPLEASIAAQRAQPTGTRFREPLTDVEVHVEDGQLAHVRARFTIVVDGAVQSHGVDHFTLVNIDGAWKVANLSYTNLAGPPK